jgi:predicted metal-dependent peptidase
MTFEVIPFDYTVADKDKFEWKRGQRPKLQRVRNGGTSFHAVVDYINDPRNRGRWEGAIICTDGECSQPPPSRVRLAYVITPGHKLMFPKRDNEIVVQMSEKDRGESKW